MLVSNAEVELVGDREPFLSEQVMEARGEGKPFADG